MGQASALDEPGADAIRRRAAERALVGAGFAMPLFIIVPMLSTAEARGPVSTVTAVAATVVCVVLWRLLRRGDPLDPLFRVAWIAGYLTFAIMSVETPLVVEQREWALRYSTEMQVSVVIVAAIAYVCLPLRQARAAASVAIATEAACLALFEVVWGGAAASLPALGLSAVAVVLIDVHGAVTARMGRAEAAARAKAFFADIDPLTGLRNRRAIEEVVTGHWPVSVLLIDLDHFKRINDVHGHAVGDETLVAVSRALERALRDEDVVGRWGGEEFIVLVRTTEAVAVAERLRAAVASAPTPLPVTASVGVAPLGGAGSDTFDRALDQADDALYRAKAAGRDAVVVAGDGVPV